MYVFGSREWMAAFHGLVAERVAALAPANPDLTLSICEVFTNPPAALSPDGAPLAWSCVVSGGEVDFRPVARDDVAFKVVVDYDAVLPLGRYDTRGDPARAAELRAMGQALAASGKMTVTGVRASGPSALGSFHDAIAKLTA